MTRIRIASFSPILLVGALFLTSCKSQPAPATQGATANQPAPAQYQASSTSQYQTPAQAGLQFINNPGGGQIFYGVVANQSTMNNAMIAMLRSVHAYFGVQPQIGQFFQSKGSDSIATFFTLNANVQGGGTKAISGLVIVSMPQGSKPLGGAMFDDAANFSKTQPVMMNTLNQAWQTAAKNAPGSANPQAAPQPTSVSLRQATAGDRSASIGLAPGWQITGVSGGQLTASGPNGELIGLGLLYQGIHPPGSMQQYGASGPILVAPVGGDLFNSFVSVSGQIRQSRKLSVGTYKLISSQNIAPQTIQAIFEVDMHDGKGMRKGSARIGEIITRGLPTWAMTVSTSNAPETVFDAQNPTILAMIHSYSQNAAVIGQETQAVINNIHAIGARAAQQAADADSRRIASSQAFNQHMDDIDRSSKAFQNYQFDSSQLQVSGGGQAARATVSNATAAALVQSDPSRYQIVQSQDFIKGVDY